jgi:hypothetical protein
MSFCGPLSSFLYSREMDKNDTGAGDDIELAWEELMQEKLASLARKKVVAGKKKGREVSPAQAVERQKPATRAPTRCRARWAWPVSRPWSSSFRERGAVHVRRKEDRGRNDQRAACWHRRRGRGGGHGGRGGVSREAILARQRALLRWVASGFRGEFEPARGFSPEDEKKWIRLKASLLCDQRAWKKSKRSDADKEIKNEKGIKGEARYCSRFIQDTG